MNLCRANSFYHSCQTCCLGLTKPAKLFTRSLLKASASSSTLPSRTSRNLLLVHNEQCRILVLLRCCSRVTRSIRRLAFLRTLWTWPCHTLTVCHLTSSSTGTRVLEKSFGLSCSLLQQISIQIYSYASLLPAALQHCCHTISDFFSAPLFSPASL